MDGTINYKEEILRLKKEKNAVIMSHYYCNGELQDIADKVGDSLALAQCAAETDADIIVVCGVHFMGETAKILSPDKKVLIPDAEAGCSLADSCNPDDFKAFLDNHKGYTAITYVNTSAAIKALSDVVVTSSNAKRIVDSFPEDEKIIFGPDRNLGSYINRVTGRNMLLWDGACHVHDRFSANRLSELKKTYPEALLLAHPECRKEVLDLADYIGSTSGIIEYAGKSSSNSLIIITESGILHKIKQLYPDKTFIPLSIGGPVSCNCNECEYMKMNTMEKLYLCLRDETPEVFVDEQTRIKAVKPIERMLELSK